MDTQIDTLILKHWFLLPFGSCFVIFSPGSIISLQYLIPFSASVNDTHADHDFLLFTFPLRKFCSCSIVALTLTLGRLHTIPEFCQWMLKRLSVPTLITYLKLLNLAAKFRHISASSKAASHLQFLPPPSFCVTSPFEKILAFRFIPNDLFIHFWETWLFLTQFPPVQIQKYLRLTQNNPHRNNVISTVICCKIIGRIKKTHQPTKWSSIPY